MDSAHYLEWPFFEPRHRELYDRLAAWATSHQQELDSDGHDIESDTRDIAAELGKAGWLRYLVPATLGGALPSVDVRSLCLIRETLAFHSGIADCAFALSEPESGSDVASLRTTARRDGDGYVLNGAKTWISNAGIANHYIVFARTGEPGDAKGLAAFVVEAGIPGLAITEKLGIVAPHVIGTIVFNDCRVDASALLGQPGEGFRIAMSTLDIFRATVGAAALGFARRALHEAIDRVGRRDVFGQKLAQFQATQMRIADMAVEVDAAALLVYRAAWTKDTQERRVTRESAMAKLYATEAAQRVIDSAVQLFGGLGVTVGSVVERLYREVRPLRIYEGTSEIQKIIIAAQLLGKNY